MTTFAEALLNPNSRKEVFTVFDLRSHVYAWEFHAAPNVWKIVIQDVEVINLTQDGVTRTQAGSYGALAEYQWFWDGGEETLYFRPPAGVDPFPSFFVATLRFRFNRDGEEGTSGDPYEARVSSVPSFTTKTGETFDGKVGASGAGALGLGNVDALFNRGDIEPDGEVRVVSRLKTFGGV